MKKLLYPLIVLGLTAAIFSGCCLSHEWQEATCEAPRTCARCGKTEGSILAHDWQEATCTAPKTCKDCGTTDGEPLEHDVLITHMYARSYDGVCKTCNQSLSETVTEEIWREMAPEVILGEWYAALLKRNEKYYLVKEGGGMYIDFHADGSVHWIIDSVEDRYDETGTWTFNDLVIASQDGTVIFAYDVNMPDGKYLFSIQAQEIGNYDNIKDVTILPGFTLFCQPNGTQMPFTIYTRR